MKNQVMVTNLLHLTLFVSFKNEFHLSVSQPNGTCPESDGPQAFPSNIDGRKIGALAVETRKTDFVNVVLVQTGQGIMSIRPDAILKVERLVFETVRLIIAGQEVNPMKQLRVRSAISTSKSKASDDLRKTEETAFNDEARPILMSIASSQIAFLSEKVDADADKRRSAQMLTISGQNALDKATGKITMLTDIMFICIIVNLSSFSSYSQVEPLGSEQPPRLKRKRKEGRVRQMHLPVEFGVMVLMEMGTMMMALRMIALGCHLRLSQPWARR